MRLVSWLHCRVVVFWLETGYHCSLNIALVKNYFWNLTEFRGLETCLAKKLTRAITTKIYGGITWRENHSSQDISRSTKDQNCKKRSRRKTEERNMKRHRSNFYTHDFVTKESHIWSHTRAQSQRTKDEAKSKSMSFSLS